MTRPAPADSPAQSHLLVVQYEHVGLCGVSRPASALFSLLIYVSPQPLHQCTDPFRLLAGKPEVIAQIPFLGNESVAAAHAYQSSKETCLRWDMCYSL